IAVRQTGRTGERQRVDDRAAYTLDVGAREESRIVAERLEEERKASVPAAAELEVRVDVKFLLDRIALLGEVRVFPCEVIHRVERERLEPGVARAEQREAMVHRRIDDASAANESARGEEILVYADDVVQKAEPLAIAIERRLPERRLRCPVLE